MNDDFSDRLLSWYEKQGRHDLPWQHNRMPYRVWVSEIMLQQTQVKTVIPYYNRFMQRFDNINVLAHADQDDVLHHWTGLGYYARARNLHKTAKMIVEQYQGKFPDKLEDLIALPGIGRSTAGAIMSLAYDKRSPILDGNVKRVLTRYHAIEGWPGKKQVEEKLWSIAESHTPKTSFAAYTQAIMDLGATLCVRRNPDCDHCPLVKKCKAKMFDRQHDYPESKAKATKPERNTIFAIIENNQGQYLLEQRPPAGVWGGLWCFPEFTNGETLTEVLNKTYGYKIRNTIEYKSIKHTFSHFHLMIKPVHVRVDANSQVINDVNNSAWLSLKQNPGIGFPAPVLSMLNDLNSQDRKILYESKS